MQGSIQIESSPALDFDDPNTTTNGILGNNAEKNPGSTPEDETISKTNIKSESEAMDNKNTATHEADQKTDLEGKQVNEYWEEDQIDGEQVAGGSIDEKHSEHGEEEESVVGEENEHVGEEEVEGEKTLGGEQEAEKAVVEQVMEEEPQYVEEPPPDPAAPFNFSDSKQAMKEPFELKPEQLAEVEQLWDLYQNYTPAYSNIDGYITEKELVYMLKALLLMTFTPEQLQELIEFCIRPPHPKGHITYEQFLKIVTLRQRDVPIEESLRSALCVMDPDKTGVIDREFFKDVLAHQGQKMIPKQLENLVKEIDLSNDGTIGIEDVVGTLCIDLNPEDLIMLRESLFPSDKNADQDADDFEESDGE